MPDYKEMYLKIFRASEQAIDLIIRAQRECEELYISELAPGLKTIAAAGSGSGEERPDHRRKT